MTPSRRRIDPNPGPDTLATSELLTSNSTLNHFLGGTQRPWMTSQAQASSPFGATPPKRKAAKPKPRPQQVATPPTITPQDANLGRRSSNSTSPLLANVLSNKDTFTRSAVLPSPTPSDEAHPCSMTTATTIDNGTNTPNEEIDDAHSGVTSSVGSFIILNGRPENPDRMASRTLSMENVSTSDNIRKRVAGVQLNRTNKRRASGCTNSPQSGQPGVVGVNVMTYQSPYLSASRPEDQHYAAPCIPHTENQGHHQELIAKQQRARAAAEDRLMSHGHTPHVSPMNVRPSDQTQLHMQISPLQTSPVPLTSSTSARTEYYTYEECKYYLNQMFSRTRLGQRDTQRLEALNEAVEGRDWFYLTMHQYYCLSSVDYSQLPRQWAGPQLSQPIAGVWKILSEVLDVNTKLDDGLLHWFATFPRPLQQLEATWPIRYNEEKEKFENFAQRSYALYGAFKIKCKERLYPPLVQEMIWDLGINSPTFQRRVFLCILRSLYVPPVAQMDSNSLEVEASSLLRKCQTDYEQLRSQKRQTNQPHKDNPRDRVREQQAYGDRLKALYCQWKARLRPGVRETNSASFALTQPALQSQSPHSINFPPFPISASPVQTAHLPSRSSASSILPAASQQIVPPNVSDAPVSQPQGCGRPPIHADPPYVTSQHGRPPTNSNINQAYDRLRRPSTEESRAPPRVVSSSGSRPTATRLMPSRGEFRPQPFATDPGRSALHQAHLRSPILRALESPSSLYQFVKGYLKTPWRLEPSNRPLQMWKFPVPEQLLQLRPRDEPGIVGAPWNRLVTESNQIYQFRCAKWAHGRSLEDHLWATTTSDWPEFAYFRLNGVSLQPRKKLHNGKNLPIDITPFLRSGENVLEVAQVRHPNDKTALKYLLAIEIVGFRSRDSIERDCLDLRRIPAASILESIRKRFSGSDGDDECVIVGSSNESISITLFDPFSACKIFDIPVRGKHCPHPDCFDLQIFLDTRRRKGDVSVNDQWQCPICKADARPESLIVDGFLEQVRSELEKQGLLNTRAILVEKNGSWKPKPEQFDGVQDRNSPEEEGRQIVNSPTSVSVAASTSRPVSMVIDLSVND